ncbi:hypothetical protein DFH29DRAFT_252901 [Suillus ampliporus]|nr:hypothetical protein DFH29DRAFT_252901 [Suillus ampliporus]
MSNFPYAQPNNAEFQVTSSTPMMSFSKVSEKRSWFSDQPSELDMFHERRPELSLVQLEHHCLLTQNRLIWRRVKAIFKALILLFLSTGYLAFCYSVNRRAVPLKSLGTYSITPNHFETVKSAITTLNIALVTLALYPVYDILLELKRRILPCTSSKKVTRGTSLDNQCNF